MARPSAGRLSGLRADELGNCRFATITPQDRVDTFDPHVVVKQRAEADQYFALRPVPDAGRAIDAGDDFIRLVEPGLLAILERRASVRIDERIIDHGCGSARWRNGRSMARPT